MRQFIGSYGPFRLNGEFAFSDFSSCGEGHNNGFEQCIISCKGARCVFDVGAHIGLVTLPMSKVIADGGMAYAFEPARQNLKHLRGHLNENKMSNVSVIDCLVGETDENRVTFYESADASGLNSFVERNDSPLYKATSYRQISLDGFCEKNQLSPGVIKIDVEGAELSVLQGASEILRRSRPVIFLSVHPGALSSLGHSVDELVTQIDALGYECREMDGSPIKEFQLAEYKLFPKGQQC